MSSIWLFDGSISKGLIHVSLAVVASCLCLEFYHRANLYIVITRYMYGIKSSTLLAYMKNKAFSTTELSDILRLVEFIPIDNGQLQKSINAKISLKDDENNIHHKTLRDLFGPEDASDHKNKKKDTISFRDIVRILIKFLKGADLKESKIALGGRLEELRKIGITYPAQYLLFDFCLAALEGDHLDAKLYLAHGFQILGLSQRFNLLLSAIVYTPLTNDEEVRELLTLLAVISQPVDTKVYLELYGEDFRKRYEIFQNELIKIK